jgi:hypothetical protein
VYVKAKFGELTVGEFADVVVDEAEEYDLYGYVNVP